MINHGQGAPAGIGTAQVKVSVAGQTSVAVPSAEVSGQRT